MEDPTLSVSKGVFVYKNKKISDYKNLKKKEGINENIFSQCLWFQSYKAMWTKVEQKLENLNDDMFTSLLKNLVEAVKSSFNETVTEIPTKALLTGINMPDHFALFSTLCKDLKKSVTPHVAILREEDCTSLKNLVESTVNQFVNKVVTSNSDDEESDSDESKARIRKTQCSFSFLQVWYESYHGSLQQKSYKTRSVDQPLVIVIPDFESFNDKHLQDFILIISSYLNILPIILIFGVATSINAIHKTLPFHVSSKINIQIFNSQPSHLYLNRIIENVLLTDDCPFHLGGKVFQCFIDIFLYYDLSVNRFIKNFKYAMLEHYSSSNIMALCTSPHKVIYVIDHLSADDIETIQNFKPFKHYSKNKDSNNFKEVLKEELQLYYSYFNTFHLYLKCLHVLVSNLPNSPLGKQVRELYCTAASGDITKTVGYVESFKILSFHSKEELTEKVSNMCEILENYNSKFNKVEIKETLEELQGHVTKIEAATTEVIEESKIDSEKTEQALSNKMDRRQLKQKLFELTKTSKPMNKYEKAREALIDYLQSIFQKYLKCPISTPFYEIFFFNDLSIKQVILGSHRSVIHTALINPHGYFHCDCCKLANEETILANMPDVCILYKLHLEYGKLINLHDWLQSFLAILEPDMCNDSDEKDEIKTVRPELHARFTQGVADLEYLGFVKSYKKKADHVVRLTWGG